MQKQIKEKTASKKAIYGEKFVRPPRDPSLYINRELSWLEFNESVLEEVQDSEESSARAGEIPLHCLF